MKVAILGTRGIPNHYGGFEQFAAHLSRYLAKQGEEVHVYSSSNHPYQKKEWNGVHIIHQNDPEDRLGTVGQFIYDLNCIMDARKRDYDIILQLGYTSSSIWGWLLPKKSVVITNMDGVEWKRSKFSKPVQQFLKRAEKWAVSSSDYLVADSIGIQQMIKEKYGVDSKYIPYGATIPELPDTAILEQYQVESGQYRMLIARLEPENNIDMILEGVAAANNKLPFLVVGKLNTKHALYLKEKYQSVSNIRFLGGIYDMDVLNALRFNACLYFHGHSVGGTNPSLLEAMASFALIVAHDNVFNRSILEDDALYFSSAAHVSSYVDGIKKQDHMSFVESNLEKIRTLYTWDHINRSYENYFLNCLNHKN